MHYERVLQGLVVPSQPNRPHEIMQYHDIIESEAGPGLSMAYYNTQEAVSW
jgi:hypothetical protein